MEDALMGIGESDGGVDEFVRELGSGSLSFE